MQSKVDRLTSLITFKISYKNGYKKRNQKALRELLPP